MALDIRPLKPTANDVLLDAIRADGSPSYQERIPEATKAGVQAVSKALQTWRPQQNEFIDALVNQIGLRIIRNTSWTNPLAEFKSGFLTYGDTIQESKVGLIKATNYDPDRDELERELFGTKKTEVQSNFHKRNRMDRYGITINTMLMHAAFTDGNGLSSFAGELMAAPSESDQFDEFLLMCQLFPEYEANGGYFKVNIRDVASPLSTEADAKDALRKLRSTASKLKFRSTRYNAAHMSSVAKPDELILFVTPDFNAAIDVEALAGAFNIDKANMSGRVIEIPEEQFGIDGAQALLTTKEFFVVADTLFETASQWNPAALQNNYWLHHHQVISASRFVPAVLFTTKGGDEIITVSTPVTSVSTITIFDRNGDVPSTVERGEIYSLDATAITTPADGVNSGVRWSVAGATSPRSYITQTGVLHVGGDEGGTTLTVTATSTWLDPSGLARDGKTSTLALTVSGEAVIPEWPESDPVTGISIDGVAVSPTFAVGTFTYTANTTAGTITDVDQVTVTGPDSSDVDIVIVSPTVFTVTALTAPGDPVYTVTVS